MLLKIAWRNIWRNRTRSWVVIGSIVIGIWSLLFMLSYSYSFVNSYISDAIKINTSHFQLHHPKFIEDQAVRFEIEDTKTAVDAIRSMNHVIAASERTSITGMVRSSRSARGVKILGIIPEQERLVSSIHEKIIEGKYFTDGRRNEIVISQKLAERLGVKLRKKVVLQFIDIEDNITAGSFRVVGIFKSGNAVLDESFVQVRKQDLNTMVGNEDRGHEIAVLVDDVKSMKMVQDDLVGSFPNLVVQNYGELAPDVALYESQIDVSARMFTFIFMLALIFGIINTMLMAVLERSKELGMLMAVGMNKVKVFAMIVIETLFLGIIAVPIGLLLTYLSINYLGSAGIDLSNFSKGMEQFGMSTILYPDLPTAKYWDMSAAVLVTALLASLYPAYKAIKLKPVEALQKI